MFRYCRSCRLDFDDVQVAPEPPESQPPPGWLPPAKPRPIGRYVAVGLAGLLGLSVIGSLTGSAPRGPGVSPPDPSIAAAATFTPRATTVPSDGSIFGSEPSGPTVEATVVRVIDGDTIIAEFGGVDYHIRYIGMDTPESVKPDTPVQPMALAATAANKTLVEGKTVVLEKDVSETDRYDRLLRNVWVEHDGGLILVGLELVRTGFAQVTTYPPDVKYVDLLLAAQGQARTAAIGLWAVGTVTPAPTVATAPVPFVGGGGNCHPSYSPCLPIVDDLDCTDVRAMGKAPVTIKGPDVYRLDRDGDGLGCE